MGKGTDLASSAGSKTILKALLEGPKTFGELSKAVNVHTLQRRLAEFKREGIVSRTVLTDRRVEYALTPRGLEVASKLLGAERIIAPDLKDLIGDWYEPLIQEWKTYWEMRPRLLIEYRGKFVAVCGGKILAVAATLQEAVKRARERCGNRPMYVGKVGEEFTPAIVKSPRREVVYAETQGKMAVQS